MKIVSAKSKKKKTAKITWKKVDGAEGYVIQYAVKKNFKGAKKLAVKKAAAVKVTLRKLKSGKNYFVRVSGYKTVNGAKIYTKTSTPKRVRIR